MWAPPSLNAPIGPELNLIKRTRSNPLTRAVRKAVKLQFSPVLAMMGVITTYGTKHLLVFRTQQIINPGRRGKRRQSGRNGICRASGAGWLRSLKRILFRIPQGNENRRLGPQHAYNN